MKVGTMTICGARSAVWASRIGLAVFVGVEVTGAARLSRAAAVWIAGLGVMHAAPGASAEGEGKATFVSPLHREQSKASSQKRTVDPLDETSSSQQSLLLLLGRNDVSPQQFLQPSLNWEKELRLASLCEC